MNLKLYFTKAQYLKYNMNISSYVPSTLMHNSFFLLGKYSNNSFIKLNITLNKIKFNLSVLSKFSKVNYNNYFIINIIENINMIKFYKKNLIKFNLDFYLGRWKNGLFNNFTERLPFLNDYINLKMRKIRLPSFIFLIDYKESLSGIDKVSPISLEFFRISSNSFILSQASTDFKKTTNVINLSIKNIASNLFLMNFVIIIIKKYHNLKKYFFFLSVTKNETIDKHFLCSKKKLFILKYINMKYSKKRNYKLKVWKNDLI